MIASESVINDFNFHCILRLQTSNASLQHSTTPIKTFHGTLFLDLIFPSHPQNSVSKPSVLINSQPRYPHLESEVEALFRMEEVEEVLDEVVHEGQVCLSLEEVSP
jgi:hypothetical protein